MHKLFFLLDNAPCHRKYSDNSLIVSRIDGGPGGEQAIMKDTFWNGHMVAENGIVKQVLTERGINTHGMNAAKMREELLKHDDFRNTKTLVQELVERRGHKFMFFPKLHCELIAIERCWCHAKKYTRQYANGSITCLRKIVPKSLDTCKPVLIRKFFITCRDYLKADCFNPLTGTAGYIRLGGVLVFKNLL